MFITVVTTGEEFPPGGNLEFSRGGGGYSHDGITKIVMYFYNVYN